VYERKSKADSESNADKSGSGQESSLKCRAWLAGTESCLKFSNIFGSEGPECQGDNAVIDMNIGPRH